MIAISDVSLRSNLSDSATLIFSVIFICGSLGGCVLMFAFRFAFAFASAFQFAFETTFGMFGRLVKFW